MLISKSKSERERERDASKRRHVLLHYQMAGCLLIVKSANTSQLSLLPRLETLNINNSLLTCNSRSIAESFSVVIWFFCTWEIILHRIKCTIISCQKMSLITLFRYANHKLTIQAAASYLQINKGKIIYHWWIYYNTLIIQ